MFKNVTAYKANNPETSEFFKAIRRGDYQNFLPNQLAREPGATQWRCFGLAKPSYSGSSVVFCGAKAAILAVDLSQRILPGKVIQQAMSVKITDIEAREDRKIQRTEYAQVKQQVTDELLPNAFVRSSITLVMIVGDWMLFDTASAKLADDTYRFISDVFTSVAPEDMVFSVRLLQGHETNNWLRKVAVSTNEDKSFYADQSIVLKGDGTVRLKDVDFSADTVRFYTDDSYKVTELGMYWSQKGDDVSVDMKFALTDHLAIKRIKFADFVVDEGDQNEKELENPQVRFDATMTIVSAMLVALVEQLAEILKAPKVADDGDVVNRAEETLDTMERIMEESSNKLWESLAIDGVSPTIVSVDEDELYERVRDYVVSKRKPNASAIQREFSIGHNQATRLIERMEEAGLVSKVLSNGTREVLDDDEL